MNLPQLRAAMLARDQYLIALVEMVAGEDSAQVLKNDLAEIDRLIEARTQ